MARMRSGWPENRLGVLRRVSAITQASRTLAPAQRWGVLWLV